MVLRDGCCSLVGGSANSPVRGMEGTAVYHNIHTSRVLFLIKSVSGKISNRESLIPTFQRHVHVLETWPSSS